MPNERCWRRAGCHAITPCRRRHRHAIMRAARARAAKVRQRCRATRQCRSRIFYAPARKSMSIFTPPPRAMRHARARSALLSARAQKIDCCRATPRAAAAHALCARARALLLLMMFCARARAACSAHKAPRQHICARARAHAPAPLRRKSGAHK